MEKLTGREKVNPHLIANKVNELIDEIEKISKEIERLKEQGKTKNEN